MFPGLGIILLIAGLTVIWLVWLFIKMLPRSRSTGVENRNTPHHEPANSNDAILILQPGGRVEYLSLPARRFFNLRENEPYDIERLARHVRPADDFLDLCVSPGSKRVSIGGKPVEISSYQVPDTYPRMLISLRDRDTTSPLNNDNGTSAETLRAATEFSQGIAASLDLDATIRSIMDHVSRLIPSDVFELKLWNEDRQALIPYRLQKSATGRLVTSTLSQFGALTESLVQERTPVMLANINSEMNSATDSFLGVQSYLGVPLIAAGKLVGTLEAGQMSSNAFGQHDLDILALISGQAAIAIRNAVLFEEEQRRAAELSGLANLNQALGSIRDVQDVFSHLVTSITPLFKTHILGFLLYDEDKRTLEGKVPFEGMPPHVVEIYRATIAPNSPAEKIIASQQPIITMNALEDENWRALGLTDVATAASLRDNALIPLLSSGRMFGYLQVGHHTRGIVPFTEEEIRLMNIVANQAAAIIENVLLVQQARVRAQRADALRRIASLASTAELDEILKYSVQELVGLFQADMGAVFLLDETRGMLTLSRESTYGVPSNVGSSFIQIFVDDPNYRFTVSGSRRSFLSGSLSTDRRVLPVYRPLATALMIESAVVVPLVVRERSIGELMIGSYKPNLFNTYDLQLISTAAGQIATAVESAGVLTQTDDTLRRQVDQLSTIVRVGRELGASLDIKHVLQVVHDEGIRLLHADCSTVMLMDVEENGVADPRIELVHGCAHPPKLTPAERAALHSGEPHVVNDYSLGNISSPHDGVISALMIPIKYHAKPVGLLNLHSTRPNFFSAEAVELAQMFAGQAGIAFNNARRYQTEKQRSELVRRRAETLQQLNTANETLKHDQPLDQALQIVANSIRKSTPFRVVLISIVEKENAMLQRITGVGIPQEALTELLSRKQPLSSVQQLMREEFKVSRSYIIPSDQTPVMPSDLHMVTLDVSAAATGSDNAAELWTPEDFYLIPLENADGEVIGLISLDDPSNGLRPDRATIEMVEVFATQASLLITNILRQGSLRGRIDALSISLERQQKLINVSQNDLPILLHKDLEQTIAMHSLERRTQRIRAGLAITESVSRQLDASLALNALGRETLTQLGMSVAIVAENTVEGPRVLHVMGSLPRATNVESLFGQRNPLRVCLQSGVPILIPNLDEDDEWRDVALLTSLRAKSVICLPILVEGKPVAAMLATSSEPMASFTDEDRQVYTQVSQQTSLILQNISLLNQTRRRLEEVNLLLDFSRQLAGMDADTVTRSLLDSARRVIKNAHAGAVLLWDVKAEALIPRAVSGYADNASMAKLAYRAGEALPGTIYLNKKSRRVDEINFARDYNLGAENLALYQQATSGRLPVSSMFIPIVSGDQNLGLLVLDNFNATSAFQHDDEALLISLSQQVALSLDNLRLVDASQERAVQLQAMNDASAALTSSLSSGELTSSLLDQLAPIIPYDTATLWLREKDRLTVHSARGFSDTDQRLGLSISVTDSALFKEMAQTGLPILVRDVREDVRFPRLENPLLSWMGIPLFSKGELVGVIAIEKWQANFYTLEQMQVAFTFAGQSAVSLDNARLYEDSVKRATELDQRSQRLAALNHFASALTGSLDTDQILNLTAEELYKGLNASRASLVTFERGLAYWKNTLPRIRAKLPRILPDAPIFSRLRESLGIFNTDNVHAEPDLHSLMEMIGETTTALLILPLVSKQNLTALVFVQMTGDARFGINELEVARTITNQATIALENARLYQSSLRTAERLSVINESSFLVNASLDPEEIYTSAHRAAERLMPAESFVITLLDEEANEVEPVYLFDRGKRYTAERIPFGKGMSSEVIKTAKPILVSNLEQADSMDTVQAGEEGEETQSIVAVPMIVGGKAVGMLSAQSYKAGVYTEEDVQTLSTLANQTIVAIQNGRLFRETQELASQLELRVLERTAQLQREQHNTETLLGILTEVSSSLDLDRALNRTLSLLNDATGAEQGTILLVHAEDGLLHYRAGYGYLTERSSSARQGFALKVGEGLAGWVVKNREAVLIDDLHQDERWVRNLGAGQDHRSAIAVPMLVGEDVIGVLMIFQRAVNYFGVDMLNLVNAIAGQVAVAINNAHLYELIRDQAERLGAMFRKEKEEASRSQAILEAVADGVLVTSVENRITFINSSTARILDVTEDRLLGSSLDVFTGLFGKASTTWIATIRNWSEDPSSYKMGDTYAEQLELDNGRIILVHLAPVIFQNEFLGTVSIFRDITHEVEVDRLKSEFVATVSHELRTPMTAIKGYVDILTMGAAGALNENQMHFLEVVRNNIERLNTLVSDLLDISRIESGRVELASQPVNINQIAEDVITEVLRRSQAEDKRIAISIDTQKSVPLVLGDSDRIRQILSNLVNNAYNYTPEAGTIRVFIHQAGDDIQIDVQDTGVGIAPDHQERVFERFFRGENPLVLATPGTGLGLPIVRQLVEMHRGRIWMESTGVPGQGSTFSFTLPIYQNGA